MDYLITPWRKKYINNEIRNKECFLCKAIKSKNPKNKFILYKGKFSFIIMNLYPYNNGHLLIAPKKHVDSPLKVEEKVNIEIERLKLKSIDILKKVYKPHGFNIGMNLGRASGAGLPDHFHIHIVPRWEGDANFMALLGDTKMMFEGIEESYKKLKDYF